MPIRKRSFYRPRNEKMHLTKALVSAMAPDQTEYHVKDTGLPGLLLKITPGGKKSYLVRYRASDGAQRKLKIGKNANDMTPAAARLEAASVLQRVAKGEDPAEERFNHRHGLTFEAFQERFLTDYAEVHLAPKTVHEYRRLLAKLIVPSLGRKKLASVNRSDISALQRSLRETPVQSNHALRLVRRIYNYAEDQGVIPRGTNPAVRFREFKEEPKERLLFVLCYPTLDRRKLDFSGCCSATQPWTAGSWIFPAVSR